MANQKTIHNRRKFLEKYGSGPRSYFRREGGIVMGLVTILLVGAGAFCLSDSSLSAYHYMLTQARKTMAAFPDPEAAFHSSFETTNMDHSWNDASVYVPPTPPAPAATRP